MGNLCLSAETPLLNTTSDGSRARPYETVKPLADSLGLKIDDSVSRDDAEGVAKAVEKWNGKGNILICWEHGQLTDIAEAIGVKHAPDYPDERYDSARSLVVV